MRFTSIILLVTLVACGNGESTQLLQIPRVMRNALGSRNHAIQVPNGHPVESPTSDDAEAETESAVERVRRKKALQKIKARHPHAASDEVHTNSKSGKKSKSHVKSHKLHAVHTNATETDSDHHVKSKKLRQAPSAKKVQNKGTDEKVIVKKGKAHHHKMRRSTTTSEANQ